MGMGCDFIDEMVGTNKIKQFCKFSVPKDGLDVYCFQSFDQIFFESNKFVCPLCNNKLPENEVKNIKSLKRNDVDSFKFVCQYKAGETISDYKDKLKDYENMINGEENFLKTLYYKHKCIKTNQEIYLWLYTGNGFTFRKYIEKDHNINLNLRDIKYKINKNEKKTRNANYNNYNNYDDGKITKEGYFRGKKLCGKVQVVDAFPDFKVQVVDSFPDLKVQKVDCFPDEIGKWQFVDVFPDFKIQYVDAFPDFKIQFVDVFPGVCL